MTAGRHLHASCYITSSLPVRACVVCCDVDNTPATGTDAVVVHCDPLLYPLMGGFVHAGLPQKNGVRFEATLRKREQHNPRFAFLVPDSAHHWFYR